MHGFMQDLRFAARLMVKSRGFTAVALATLALAIGANATIFSLVDTLFLRPLPVPDAHRIVHVDQTRPGRVDRFPLSLADYQYFRSRSTAFSELAAHYPTAPLHLVVEGEPRSVSGSVATASYFTVLGIQPALGRFFSAAEDSVPDRDAVAVISYHLWQERFAGASAVIGQTLRLNGRVFSIVGVAPKGFVGVLPGVSVVEVWIPSAMFRTGYRFCNAFERGCTVVQLLGRLKPSSDRLAAQAELDVLARQLADVYPATNKDLGVSVIPAVGTARIAGQGRVVALLLAAVVALLLVACANLAGLLLARAIRRRREIAARLVLGATRGRVIRQLLTESALLSFVGGALGLAVALWGTELIQAVFATDYAGRPMNFTLEIGWRVAAATLALSVLTTLVFGTVPALQTRGADIVGVLRDEGVAGGPVRSRLRSLLVVAQVALSVVLLSGALLLVRSVQHLYTGPGFDPSRVIILRLRPSLVDRPTDQAWAFQKEVVRRLEALPGVASASVSEYLPVFGSGERVELWPDGRKPERPADAIGALSSRIGSGYFKTLGLPVLEGREFTSRDERGAPAVTIVNDILARRLWPGASALGKTLVIDGRPHEVVGIVRDAQYHSIAEEAQPYLYRSYWQQTPGAGWVKDSRTHVRVQGDARAMMTAIRREVAAVDPSIPIGEDYPLLDRVTFTFRPLRVATLTLVSFGGLAIFLSAIGLYGVLALTVSQRTREIAIRMALGAGHARVARAVLRQSLALAATGAVVGVAVSAMGARQLASFMYGVPQYDPIAFVGAPLMLVAVALTASYLPARRATRVEPSIALRYD